MHDFGFALRDFGVEALKHAGRIPSGASRTSERGWQGRQLDSLNATSEVTIYVPLIEGMIKFIKNLIVERREAKIGHTRIHPCSECRYSLSLCVKIPVRDRGH